MYKNLAVISAVAFCLCIQLPSFVDSGVALGALGLYNSSDKVVILTETNFKSSVLNQEYSSLVEFYNSYCGHCKRFAPTYKELASELWSWRDIIKIMAIDCASDENNDICREYEVMAYPTMRYFGPHFQPTETDYGRKVDSLEIDVIRTSLALWIAKDMENRTTDTWPNFAILTEKEANNGTIFTGLPAKTQQILLVFEPDNSTVGIETILNFNRFPALSVRRIRDSDIANKFQLDEHNRLAAIDKQGKVTLLPVSEGDTDNLYKSAIQEFLKLKQYTERPPTTAQTKSISTNPIANGQLMAETEHNKAIRKEVKKNKHFVYQADLEMALRTVLHNEIPKINEFSGERLLALQRFMSIINRYNPMGERGKTFIGLLYEFVMNHNQQITGKQFEDKVNELHTKYDPIFSSSHFVGCAGSKPGLRGFTCSLWQLFHFVTVQAAENDKSADPLEVLQAMHGYVKYIFGCTECSEHFQEMATRRKIWSTPSKDEAILWLWSAHNEVNERLAGDPTEDAEFPKIQFPSANSCPMCYREPSVSPATKEPNWDKNEVLGFMKNIHNAEYVSRYDVEREELLRPSLEKLRQKRLIGNVFSEIDMRMGMLLYGFCIVMMIVAFKLFAFKGYRKKTYGHDFMGKV